jgi:hypothetical protein
MSIVKRVKANSSWELGKRLYDLLKVNWWDSLSDSDDEDGEDDAPPSPAVMQSLIDRGAYINFQMGLWGGDTVLHLASFYGNHEAVKMFLAAEGINIYAKNANEHTVFTAACSNGHVEIVKELLAAHKKSDPDFDINNFSQETALMYACRNSRVEVVKFLLSIPNIKIHLEKYSGATALKLAKGSVNEDEIRKLFQGEFFAFSSAMTTERSFKLSSRHLLKLSLSSLAHIFLSVFFLSSLLIFKRALLTLSFYSVNTLPYFFSQLTRTNI